MNPRRLRSFSSGSLDLAAQGCSLTSLPCHHFLRTQGISPQHRYDIELNRYAVAFQILQTLTAILPCLPLLSSKKGGKDRYSLLSETNLLLLRQYWKRDRPTLWLFPGVPDTKSISVRTIQSVFKDSLHAAGISKDVSVHTLRHCFATHLLNQGASILQIKELLGHADIQTTSMYLHLTHAQVLGLKSPLDLPPEGGPLLQS